MAKIYINAGHDIKLDSGAVNSITGLREADVVHDIGLKVCKYLSAVGHTVDFGQSDALTRDIINVANRWKTDIFVSIHCNSNAGNPGTGIETFYYPNEEEDKKLAKYIQCQLVDTLKINDRGIKTGTFGVLANTNMPAVLVETAFINNQAEERILASDSGKDEIAKAIARGITDYFANK